MKIAQTTGGASLAQAILSRLAIAPYSVAELADDMKAHPRDVRRAVKRLVSAGGAVFLQGRPVDDGPFLCLPNYREPAKTLDKTEAYLWRSYALFYTGEDPD